MLIKLTHDPKKKPNKLIYNCHFSTQQFKQTVEII